MTAACVQLRRQLANCLGLASEKDEATHAQLQRVLHHGPRRFELLLRIPADRGKEEPGNAHLPAPNGSGNEKESIISPSITNLPSVSRTRIQRAGEANPFTSCLSWATISPIGLPAPSMNGVCKTS